MYIKFLPQISTFVHVIKGKEIMAFWVSLTKTHKIVKACISPWLKPLHVGHHSALDVHRGSISHYNDRPLDFLCSPQSCSSSGFYSDRLLVVRLDLLHEPRFCTPLWKCYTIQSLIVGNNILWLQDWHDTNPIHQFASTVSTNLSQGAIAHLVFEWFSLTQVFALSQNV